MTDELKLSLTREGNVAARARRFIGHALADAGLDAAVAGAELAVTELVANALIHTSGPITITARVDAGGIRIEVADTSPTEPVALPLIEGSLRSTGGRGLHLVASVARQWGWTPTAQGKIVWFELAPGEPPEEDFTADELLAMWDNDPTPATREPAATRCAELTGVPVGQLVELKRHNEDLVRELRLALHGPSAASGSGSPRPSAGSGETIPHPDAPGTGHWPAVRRDPRRASAAVLALAREYDGLAHLLDPLRLAIRNQAYAAAAAGQPSVDVRVQLPRGAAGTLRAYAALLQRADELSRRGELLTVASTAEAARFREDVLARLQAAAEATAEADRPGPGAPRLAGWENGAG